MTAELGWDGMERVTESNPPCQLGKLCRPGFYTV